jgi:hypothetical protein
MVEITGMVGPDLMTIQGALEALVRRSRTCGKRQGSPIDDKTEDYQKWDNQAARHRYAWPSKRVTSRLGCTSEICRQDFCATPPTKESGGSRNRRGIDACFEQSIAHESSTYEYRFITHFPAHRAVRQAHPPGEAHLPYGCR